MFINFLILFLTSHGTSCLFSRRTNLSFKNLNPLGIYIWTIFNRSAQLSPCNVCWISKATSAPIVASPPILYCVISLATNLKIPSNFSISANFYVLFRSRDVSLLFNKAISAFIGCLTKISIIYSSTFYSLLWRSLTCFLVYLVYYFYT